MYWISNFYVSRALQGSGLGRAAMDTVERLAISEPLCATTLGLNAINKVDPDREEKYRVLGLDIPPVKCLNIGNCLAHALILYSSLIKSGMRGGVIKFINM